MNPPFDLNQDGEFDASDVDYGAWGMVDPSAYCPSGNCQTPGGILIDEIVQTPSIMDCAPGVECKYVSGSQGGIDKIDENVGSHSFGRQSWRELRGGVTMKWIACLMLLFLTSFAVASESKLVTGKLLAFEKNTGYLVIKGQAKSYPVAAGSRLETYHKLSNFISLVPGMRVSLFSEDGYSVSRILIHGPYSLIKQAETH